MKIIGLILLFAFVGFGLGCFLYSKVNDEYVNPIVFFSKAEKPLQRIHSRLHSFEKKKQNIIMTTAGGAVVGLFAGILLSLRRNTSV